MIEMILKRFLQLVKLCYISMPLVMTEMGETEHQPPSYCAKWRNPVCSLFTQYHIMASRRTTKSFSFHHCARWLSRLVLKLLGHFPPHPLVRVHFDGHSMDSGLQRSCCTLRTGPKLHLFSRDSGKTAVRGPPKLPEGQSVARGPRAVLEARGRQFLTRVPRKKVEFYHYTLVLQGFPIILAEQCL